MRHRRIRWLYRRYFERLVAEQVSLTLMRWRAAGNLTIPQDEKLREHDATCIDPIYIRLAEARASVALDGETQVIETLQVDTSLCPCCPGSPQYPCVCPDFKCCPRCY